MVLFFTSTDNVCMNLYNNGLRWQDIDIEKGIVDVNHTLVYYCHDTGRNEKGNKCYFGINTPKTKAGCRQIPMQDYVKEAFIREREYQEYNGISCNPFDRS